MWEADVQVATLSARLARPAPWNLPRFPGPHEVGEPHPPVVGKAPPLAPSASPPQAAAAVQIADDRGRCHGPTLGATAVVEYQRSVVAELRCPR
jgi:hypothetical protein